MDEKPGIVKFTPHSTSRSAMLIAVAVTVGVQVALCAVLVAIHLQDMWFPSVQGGEVEMTFVSLSEEVSQEMEEVQPTSVVPVAAPSTVSPVPEIASDEDLLAMKLPENEDCSEMKDFLLDEAPSELLPEELAVMRISMNEVKRRQPVKRRRYPCRGVRNRIRIFLLIKRCVINMLRPCPIPSILLKSGR